MKTSAVQDPPTITIAVYAGIEKLDLRGLTDAAGTTYSKAWLKRIKVN